MEQSLVDSRTSYAAGLPLRAGSKQVLNWVPLCSVSAETQTETVDQQFWEDMYMLTCVKGKGEDTWNVLMEKFSALIKVTHWASDQVHLETVLKDAEKMLSHWKWAFFWYSRSGAELMIMVSIPGITQANYLPVDSQSFPSSCARLCS